MDILHAYWRMEYIASDADPLHGHPNPFEALPSLGDDRAALIVHRATHNYIVLNRFPYNPAHLLVTPYKAIAELEALPPAARHELIDLVSFAKSVVQATLHPDGFNVGLNLGKAAGAGIPTHLHFHIVPRWNGDSNFLPVIGKTRSLPQALDTTWDILSKAFASHGGTNA